MENQVRDEFSLHWLYKKFDEYAGLLPFHDEASNVLRRLISDKEILPATFTNATSARHLLEYWLYCRKLPMRHRGKAIDEQLTGTPVNDELEEYLALSENLDGQTQIFREDLISLMKSEGMTIPCFLAPQAYAALINCKAMNAAPAPTAKSVTKQEAMIAFGAIVTNETTLQTAIENGPAWILPARVSKGTRGRGGQQSRWDPVLLAIALHERKAVTLARASRAFFHHQFLSPWREEWAEKTEELSS